MERCVTVNTAVQEGIALVEWVGKSYPWRKYEEFSTIEFSNNIYVVSLVVGGNIGWNSDAVEDLDIYE